MLFDLKQLVDFQKIDLDQLLEAANNDDPSALYIGSLLYEGGFGRNQIDDKLAVAWAKRGAGLGDALCTARYAALMHMGRGIMRDVKAAGQPLLKASADIERMAGEGSPYATSMLALMTMWGIGRKKNAEEGFRLFHLAADTGEPGAQLYLGICYENGFGIPKDPDTSFKWLVKAAATQYARGQQLLGEAFEKGIGTEVDKDRAAACYTLGARQSYPPSMLDLGVLYLDKYPHQSPLYGKGFELLCRAAEGGEVKAKFMSAELMEKGNEGIEQNMAQAYRQYVEVVDDPAYAVSDPLHYRAAVMKRSTMLIGKPRQTDEDGNKWILFPDGSKVMETGLARPAQMHTGRRPGGPRR